MSASLVDLAARLRALHLPGSPVVLPNAWDVASARRLAKGSAALATTSAGVANALGWPDGEAIPAVEMFTAVARIAAAVELPVTADLEAGYGLSPKELAARVVASGCVGLNLEDTDHARGKGVLVDASRQAERIAALKEAGRAEGVDLVVNARVDTFLGGGLTGAARIEETVRRGRLYLAAGADCIYPITAHEEGDIRAIVDGLGRAPVNVMALPVAPPLAKLAALGVARITFGSQLMRSALDEAERALQAYVAR